MKTLKLLTLALLALVSLNGCIEDDSISYIASPTGEFGFTNSFLSEYVLTQETSGNLGERFVWSDADFGVQTNVSYELQKSIVGDFSDVSAVAADIQETEYALTIGELMDFAEEAGLDNDPDTENPDTGDIYFRVKASVGEEELLSMPQAMTLTLLEEAGEGPVCEFEMLYGVGAGLPDAGWGWTTPNEFPCVGNGVYGANVNLQNNAGADNNFRFFTENGNWDSGLNYPYFADEDYTIDENLVNAEDDDSNFAFVGTSGTYYLEIDTQNKTITLSDPQATGVCENEALYGVGAGLPTAGWDWATPVQVLCTGEGVYTANVEFTADGDANFRFFTVEGDWDSGLNYLYFVDAGYTIDENFVDAEDDDNNFQFIGTSGTYLLTIDEVNLTITLE